MVQAVIDYENFEIDYKKEYAYLNKINKEGLS